MWTICILVGTNHISGTAEASVVKFCMQEGYVKSQHTDDKRLLKRLGQGHVTHFKFWGLNDISGTAYARFVKFCTQTTSSPSLRMTDHP